MTRRPQYNPRHSLTGEQARAVTDWDRAIQVLNASMPRSLPLYLQLVTAARGRAAA